MICLLFHVGTPLLPPPPTSSRYRLILSSRRGDDPNNNGTVWRRRQGHLNRLVERDLRPYDVTIMIPPPARALGTLNLEKNTQNGDLIEWGTAAYEVKRYTSNYRYNGGRFRLVGRSVQVADVTHSAAVASLRRSWQREPEVDSKGEIEKES